MWRAIVCVPCEGDGSSSSEPCHIHLLTTCQSRKVPVVSIVPEDEIHRPQMVEPQTREERQSTINEIQKHEPVELVDLTRIAGGAESVKFGLHPIR